MNKARITYRFDQNKGKSVEQERDNLAKGDRVIPLYREEFQVVEDKTTPEPLNAFTTDFSGWNSSFETESTRIEHLIRESGVEGERTAQPKSSDPKRVEGPEMDPEVWSSWTRYEQQTQPERGTRYVKAASTPWFRIAASVAAAIITGIAFGFFVLSMFTGGDLPADRSAGSVQVKQTVPAAGQAGKDSASLQAPAGDAKANVSADGTSGGGGASIPLSLAAKSYSFLQNGVFSSVQSAQSAQAELKKKGIASALQQGDKTTVFVGFAISREDALSMSQQLKEQQIEVFIKSVELPSVSAIRWKGTKPETLAAYMAQGDKLIQMLNGLTLVHLAETSHTPLDDSTLQGMRAAHQALTTQAASLNEAVDKEIKSLVDQMNTALNSSVQSMEEYKKNPSSAMLWQTQSSMMQYILTQKDLVAGIRIS